MRTVVCILKMRHVEHRETKQSVLSNERNSKEMDIDSKPDRGDPDCCSEPKCHKGYPHGPAAGAQVTQAFAELQIPGPKAMTAKSGWLSHCWT